MDVMGSPGWMFEAPMTELISNGLRSRALRRFGAIGSGGGGPGLGLMTSQIPTAPTARTSTTATAATMGQGLCLGLGGGWFQGVGPAANCRGGVGGGPAHLPLWAGWYGGPGWPARGTGPEPGVE